MKSCPICSLEMKLVKGGISKKSGKPYKAFYSCECGYTENIADPILEKPLPPIKTNGNGNVEPSMRMSYRKDLMVAVVNKYGDLTDDRNLKAVFNDLWAEIEK